MLLTPTDMPLMPFFTRLGIDARVIPTMSNYTVSKKKRGHSILGITLSNLVTVL